MSEIRLRRGILCRLTSSNVQTGLSTFCLAILAGIAYGLANGRPVFGGSLWVWIPPGVVLFLPWLAGLTAWARADDAGIHWRYWLRQHFPWEQVTRVTLTERDLSFSPVGATSTPAIVVHGRASAKRGPGTGVEIAIRPGQGAGRNLRAFAAELGTLARTHGVRVVVASSGWAEQSDTPSGTTERR